MIKEVTVGPGLMISNSNGNKFVSNTGSTRWNNNKQCLEVSDLPSNYNTVWQPLDYTIQLSVDFNVQSALEWVRKKQQEEKDLIELCENHPGLKDAKNAFDIMLALVKEY